MTEFTAADRAFLLGLAVARGLSPATSARLVAALAESTREVRAACASAIGDLGISDVDSALDGLLDGLLHRAETAEPESDDEHA